jgi:hypothetical protein
MEITPSRMLLVASYGTTPRLRCLMKVTRTAPYWLLRHPQLKESIFGPFYPFTRLYTLNSKKDTHAVEIASTSGKCAHQQPMARSTPLQSSCARLSAL